MTLLFLWIVLPWHHPWWFAQVMLHIFGPHYLASLVYLHAQIFGEPSWINGNAWTLEIEVQFYLLMPLLGRLFGLRGNGLRRWVLVALTVAAALFAQLVLPRLHDPRLELSLAGHLEFFLAGVLLADLYLDPPRPLLLAAWAGDLCALASAALVVYAVHWRPALAWCEPFGVAAFFWGTFQGRWAARLFALRWLTVPGTMCYTIYLYHAFILERCMGWTVRLLPPGHALWFDAGVQMLLMLPPVLLVSAILYLTTERPFIVLSHWATRRWRPVPAAVPAPVAQGL
jgi:peptidoglycan/LPS O-acetylase OafA/YrhL